MLQTPRWPTFAFHLSPSARLTRIPCMQIPILLDKTLQAQAEAKKAKVDADTWKLKVVRLPSTCHQAMSRQATTYGEGFERHFHLAITAGFIQSRQCDTSPCEL